MVRILLFFHFNMIETRDIVDPDEDEDGHWEFCPLVRKNSDHPSRTNYKTYSIPSKFNSRILFYTQNVRPVLLAAKKKRNCPQETHFWITVKGNPLSAAAHLEYIKDFLSQVIGRPLTIRELRLVLNAQFYWSEYANDEEYTYWFNYMMDHCQETANVYYRIYNDEKMNEHSSRRTHPLLTELGNSNFLKLKL